MINSEHKLHLLLLTVIVIIFIEVLKTRIEKMNF